MSAWKLQELRDLIERKHGEEQLSKAAVHINSVDWKLRSASYHSYMAQDAFDRIFSATENEYTHAIKMVLSTGEEASNFREAKFIYESNIIACAQAMHSVSDIISHIILDALALNVESEENLNLKSIQKSVPESTLKNRIVRVLGMKSYSYLRDFVNTTKHVRLVSSNYTFDITGRYKNTHGVVFKEFTYKKTTHAPKWGEDFLKELKELSVEFVNLGQNINDYLDE